MNLTPVMTRFILHWGEMGTRWGVNRTVAQVMSDRRDHFTTRADPWDMLVTIMEQRKRRELEPTLNFLRECARELEDDRATPKEAKARIENMLGFLTNI